MSIHTYSVYKCIYNIHAYILIHMCIYIYVNTYIYTYIHVHVYVDMI